VHLYSWNLVNGEGAGNSYPGTRAGYDSLIANTSAGLLARVAVHASLHPDKFRERMFDVADNAKAEAMRAR
jgi:hypothetical protein